MTNGRRTVSTSLLRTRSHILRIIDLSEQSSKANKNVEAPTATVLTLTTSLHAERQAVTVTTTRAGWRPRVLARWAVNPKQAHEASSILARRRTSALLLRSGACLPRLASPHSTSQTTIVVVVWSSRGDDTRHLSHGYHQPSLRQIARRRLHQASRGLGCSASGLGRCCVIFVSYFQHLLRPSHRPPDPHDQRDATRQAETSDCERDHAIQPASQSHQ